VALVNERALDTRACDDLRAGLAKAREELGRKPASTLLQQNNHFASVEDLTAMIRASQERLGKEPSAADVWSDVFEAVGKVLADAEKAKRGVYFGNL
jgi:hypothetical protein